MGEKGDNKIREYVIESGDTAMVGGNTIHNDTDRTLRVRHLEGTSYVGFDPPTPLSTPGAVEADE